MLLQTQPGIIPGVAELEALPFSPVLDKMWLRDLLPVLKSHKKKSEAALQQQALLSNPGHLSGDELRLASKAVEHVLDELKEQLDVFVEYVGRIVQVVLYILICIYVSVRKKDLCMEKR